jgi:hypothetical protein
VGWICSSVCPSKAPAILIAGAFAKFGEQSVDASSTECGMDWPDYLRDQAAMYRQRAEQTDDPVVKNELLELASVCEEVANNIEDHLTGG